MKKRFCTFMILASVVTFMFVSLAAIPDADARVKAKKKYKIAVVVPNGVDPLFLLEMVRKCPSCQSSRRYRDHVRCGWL